MGKADTEPHQGEGQMKLKGKELDKWAKLFTEVATILDMVKKGEISKEDLKTTKEKGL